MRVEVLTGLQRAAAMANATSQWAIHPSANPAPEAKAMRTQYCIERITLTNFHRQVTLVWQPRNLHEMRPPSYRETADCDRVPAQRKVQMVEMRNVGGRIHIETERIGTMPIYTNQ
jgi:hypothetical protein